MEELSLVASLGWHPTPRWGLALAAGAILDGTLGTPDGADHDVGPGVAASVSGSWLAMTETALRPFVSFGVAISASHATAGGDGLSAGDLRLSALVGKTFFEVVAPYLALRAFGGPVVWDRLEDPGGDAHHYAMGLGTILRLSRVDVSLEAIPLGEQSLTAGAGVSF